MTFSDEKALVNRLLEYLGENIRDIDNEFLFTEVESPNGVADVMLARLRKDWKSQLGLSEVHPRWLFPLVRLPLHRTISTESFRELFGCSLTTSRTILSSYELSGFVEAIPGKPRQFKKIRQPRNIILNLHAIEAKLKDWRRALFQAQRYLDYADKASVALSVDYLANTFRHKEEFLNRNISLLTVENNHVQEIIRAETRSPRFEFRRWFMMGAILRRLKDHSHVQIDLRP